MKFFILVLVLLQLCIGITTGQYFSSGFYQGGFRSAGFSPFAFQGHPFVGGAGYPGGHGHGQTHVHYHVPASRYHGGGGIGGGLGLDSRDVGAGAVGFILGSLLNRNK